MARAKSWKRFKQVAARLREADWLEVKRITEKQETSIAKFSINAILEKLEAVLKAEKLEGKKNG